MSLPSPQYLINNLHMPDYDRVLAPVPETLARGYVGMVNRIDGTIAQGTWNCSCANSFGAPTGVTYNSRPF